MDKDKTTNDDWSAWANHVLIELDRCHQSTEKLAAVVQNLRVEISMLKLKASTWGLLAGLIPVLILLSVQLIILK